MSNVHAPGRKQGERSLWVAVVHQAIVDIKNEPIGSVVFSQAAAFLTGDKEWGEARRSIGDHIDLHPDDIRRVGHRLINERRKAEGLPPLPPPPIPARLQRSPKLPMPALVLTPGPEPNRTGRATRRNHDTAHEHVFNPFNPLLLSARRR